MQVDHFAIPQLVLNCHHTPLRNVEVKVPVLISDKYTRTIITPEICFLICSAHIPSPPSAANEVWYWPKHVLWTGRPFNILT